MRLERRLPRQLPRKISQETMRRKFSLPIELKRSGAVLALMASRPDATPFPTLSPRTLPNGVENSLYTQNVSGDVVIADTDYDTTYVGNVNNDCFYLKLFSGQRVVNGGASIIGHFDIPGMQETPNNGIDNAQSIGKYTFSTTTGKLMFIMPKNTTLEQFKDAVRGKVIRYQLAVPIDTLNAYKGAWVDVAGKVGKNLFDGFSYPVQQLVNNAVLTKTSEGIRVSNTVASTFSNGVLLLQLQPNVTYTLKANSANLISGQGIISPRNTSDSTIGADANAGNNYTTTFTVPSDGVVRLKFYCSGASAVLGDITYSQIQLELGTVATAYEPYGRNNASLQYVAGTQLDGWDYELVRNSNGEVCQYSNLVTNGDFANGTTGWSSTNATGFAIVGGVAECTPTALYGGILQTSQNQYSIVSGKRYYCIGELKADTTQVRLMLQQNESPYGAVTVANSDGSNTLKKYSAIVTPSFTTSVGNFRTQDLRSSGWTKHSVDNLQLINLTDNPIVQAWERTMGRQITAAECDRIFPFVATAGQVKASPRLFLTTDGVDTYGTLANTPSLDITGLEEFEISAGFLTPNAITSVMNILIKNLDDGGPSIQYGLTILASGTLYVMVNGLVGSVTTSGYIVPNTMYDVRISRKSGRLVVSVNGVVVYNQPNNTSLVSQPNIRLFARSANLSGTINQFLFKGSLAWLSIHRATYGDITKADKLIDRIARDYMEVAA